LRKSIGGDGTDTTSALFAFLKARNRVRLANLFLIGELEDPAALFLTDYRSPLTWLPWGVFNPASIRRGTVTSEIGLTVQSLDVEWSPALDSFGTTLPTLNHYQLAQAGYYDNRAVRVWRTFMPTPGDADTYGACELFGGRVASTTTSRGNIKFSVNSFLDVINQKIPPNVIEATNTLAHYKGATPPTGFTQIPQFTVASPSSKSVIMGDCTSPSAGHIFGTNDFRYGYLVFNTGSVNAGLWAAIAQNSDFDAGGGVHHNRFQVYGGFVADPVPGDTCYVSAAFPINLQDGDYFGFPYVPPPETAV